VLSNKRSIKINTMTKKVSTQDYFCDDQVILSKFSVLFIYKFNPYPYKIELGWFIYKDLRYSNSINIEILSLKGQVKRLEMERNRLKKRRSVRLICRLLGVQSHNYYRS
jgi:hypothetical protein